MIGIPTTAGTGSEAQSYAVIADARTHMKMACGDPSAAFRVAILDPELTLTAPPGVTAAAGIDAIAHAVETAVTTRRTPLSDTFSHQGWRLLSEGFERVVLHAADVEARAMMQIGAHFAGLAIEQSMLGAAHACANPLTARFGLSHGVALAILLPHVVRWNGRIALDGYAALLGSPRRRARDSDAAETLPAAWRTSPSPARCRRGSPTSEFRSRPCRSWRSWPRNSGPARSTRGVRCGGSARDL